MANLHGLNYDEDNLEEAWYVEKREMLVGLDSGIQKSAWVVSVKEPLFNSVDFLTISDETGEPIYYQTKHVLTKIVKDANGKYITL